MPKYKKDTRRCAVCHEHSDKTELLRFVRTPSGEIVFDPSKKADGRGVWVHDTPECKSKFKKKRALNVAFKRNVPDEVYGALDE